METTEQSNKVTVSAKIDPAVRDAIQKIAESDERSLSFVIEKIIRNSPKVRAEIRRSVETA